MGTPCRSFRSARAGPIQTNYNLVNVNEEEKEIRIEIGKQKKEKEQKTRKGRKTYVLRKQGISWKVKKCYFNCIFW